MERIMAVNGVDNFTRGYGVSERLIHRYSSLWISPVDNYSSVEPQRNQSA
jgi:hypothetical protein